MAGDLASAVAALNQDFLRQYPVEAIQALTGMPPDEIAELLQAQDPARAITIWQQLPVDIAAAALVPLADDFARLLLSRADAVKVARSLLRLAGGGQAQRLNALLSPVRLHELERLMRYPENTAGALMDTNFPMLTGEMTATEALNRLRRRKSRSAQQFYFTAGEPLKLHRLEIQDLALAEPRTPLAEIARAAPALVTPTAGLGEIVEQFDRHKLAEMPVVDLGGELVGVIHYDGLVNAVRAESSADLLTMVGAGTEERALSKVSLVVRKRLPWLHLNLVTAFIAASVVGMFESTIAQFTALAILMPVVAGEAGNTGAQALAVTMRALALREISTSHWWHVARKEVGAAFINGSVIALVTALAVLIWSGSGGLAFVIAIAMIVSLVFAAFAGMTIPIVLSALGQDPAQASSIFLTTLTDITGFLTFLGIATLMVGLL